MEATGKYAPQNVILMLHMMSVRILAPKGGRIGHISAWILAIMHWLILASLEYEYILMAFLLP